MNSFIRPDIALFTQVDPRCPTIGDPSLTKHKLARTTCATVGGGASNSVNGESSVIPTCVNRIMPYR